MTGARHRCGNRSGGGALFLTLLVLTSCARQPLPEPTPPPPTAPDAALAAYDELPSGDVWTVARARLEVRVYRAGALKRLGHSHIISSEDIRGRAYRPVDPLRGYADLVLPIASFVVDDPTLRAAAGPEFASEPSPADREGTRRNMLGPRLLDAANHPRLHLRIRPTQIGPDAGRGDVRIDIAGNTQTLDALAFRLRQETPERERIETEFELTHDALGLVPYTALGGALAVAPAMDITLSLTLAPLDESSHRNDISSVSVQ